VTPEWKCCGKALQIADGPLVMGIVNVTPDSFSDGGRYVEADSAVTLGLEMLAEGADILDIGGESTRPGADEVSVDEEIGRILPVIEGIRHQAGDAIISIDTTKAGVARAAIEAGAVIINDVSALTIDPEMAAVAKEFGAGIVLMHMRGSPRTMQDDPQYEDVVVEVAEYLEKRANDLVSAGLERDTLAIDPGIGFGKTVEHNVQLLANLSLLRNMGLPVIVGLSRKSFLGKLTGNGVDERLAGSLAGMAYCALNGADVMRVHDVKESVDVARVVKELKKAEK
jgi:dihydropteroate synthase